MLLVERLAGRERGRPRGKGRGLLARECEAGRQVFSLDRVRQEHEAGRRHQLQGPAVIGDPLDPIAHAVECVAPHAAPIHDGDDVLRLRVPRPARDELLDGVERHLDGEPPMAERRHRVGRRVPELHGDERRLRQPEVGRAGVRGLEQALVVIGHRQPEARLVELEAERSIPRRLGAHEVPELTADGGGQIGWLLSIGQLAQLDDAVRARGWPTPRRRPARATAAARGAAEDR